MMAAKVIVYFSVWQMEPIFLCSDYKKDDLF